MPWETWQPIGATNQASSGHQSPVSNSSNYPPANYPSNCVEALAKSNDQSGVYTIKVSFYNPFNVYCYEGGWMVILNRTNGVEDFQRNWFEYKMGFGYFASDYFLGLDALHLLTSERRHELLVILEDSQQVTNFETYSHFAIGNEFESYTLKSLGFAAGSAGDSLSYHLGMKFSTHDQDNDLNHFGNCAQMFSGGWWYRGCFVSKLTGEYNNNAPYKGIIWSTFRGYGNSISKAMMLIRPTKTMPMKNPWHN
ncbi:hypothetical protein ACLKA7_004683 [Drosophila subpalustris]